MMKTKLIWVFLVLLGMNFSCKNADTEAPKKAFKKSKEARFDSIDWRKEYQFQVFNLEDKTNKQNFLNEFYRDHWLANATSGAFLVAQHGEIIFEAYSGFADFEKEVPITSETPIHLASISKVLTGIAILKLVEYGKLNLEDELTQYFEGFPYAGVRVEDLLNHRSGLPNYLSFSEDKAFWDKTQLMSNQDVLNVLIEKKPPLLNSPNKRFFYNNTNFVLLALIIEKVTEKPYPEAMKEMVFNPLGMKNTFVMEFDKHKDSVSRSYYNNGRDWGYDHLDATYGDKNIYSTPRDLYKMDIAMYSDEFLPQELKERAWKGYSYEAKGNKNYGLGMRMMEWEDGSKMLYHNGKWHGNNTAYVRDFSNEACIIALGNRLNGTIYSTVKLVGLFGDYPYQFATHPANPEGIDGKKLVKLQNKMDQVREQNKKINKEG